MADETDEEVKPGLILFGRDFSQVPCFRNTFLYGISSGIGAGLIHFLFTSKTATSSHVAVGSFGGVALCYWFYCRIEWSKRKFEYQKIQYAMQQHAMYEGTERQEKLQEFIEQLEESEKKKGTSTA